LIITDSYQAYIAFCKNDGKKEPEKKSNFRKVLKDLGYRIDNTRVNGNMVIVLLKELAEGFRVQTRYVG
jgi:hypothetical protein